MLADWFVKKHSCEDLGDRMKDRVVFPLPSTLSITRAAIATETRGCERGIASWWCMRPASFRKAAFAGIQDAQAEHSALGTPRCCI